MKWILAALAMALLLLAPAGHGQVSRSDAEVMQLRRDVDALARQVEALRAVVEGLASQLVTALQINVATEYFGGGGQSSLQPKVLSAYPGQLVSASVTLVRTEREGAGTFEIGRSVVITPGGSAAIAVEGADALCNWVVFDEGNAIKVRNENCTYLARGLRGYFTGAAYYRR